MSEILSVRQLTERIRNSLEKAFPYLWVRGEVTNVSRPGSGHVYFSLRDGDDLLNCVWFRGMQRDREAFDPVTGEVFEDGPRPCLARTMRDGDQLACAGTLTVYGPRGAYQLRVELAQETGQGDLLRRLERLKRELAAKGWFAESRKRELPANPARVALITAPTGAAVRDFLRIADERGTGAEIRIYPVPVQGAEAASKITQALRRANADDWAEVVVLIRGGGSLEDLWAFNDETLAAAIVESRLPVLTGIGHEVDTAVADLVADRRAATPSHAAQLLWREREWHAQRLDAVGLHLGRLMERRFAAWIEQLAMHRRGLEWLSPKRRLLRTEERAGQLGQALLLTMERRLRAADETLNRAVLALRRENPEAVMAVGAQRLAGMARELDAGLHRRLERAAQRLSAQEVRLAGLDPHGPLRRGYALIYREAPGKHDLLRRATQAGIGERLRLRLHDGELDATITAVHPKGN